MVNWGKCSIIDIGFSDKLYRQKIEIENSLNKICFLDDFILLIYIITTWIYHHDSGNSGMPENWKTKLYFRKYSSLV